MKISRREFLKAAFISAGGLWGSTLSGHLKGNSELPNVIILVFDSLSARHLSLLGYPRATTPNLQKFAETATVYHRHYAAGNFTSPGAASILTGAYPWTHRAMQQAGLVKRELTDRNLFGLLDGAYQKVAFAQNVWADLFLHQFRESIDVHIKSTSFSIVNEIHYNDTFSESDPLASFRAYDDFLEQDFGIPGSLYFSLFDKAKSYLAQQMLFPALAEEYPHGIPNFLKYKLHYLLSDVFYGVRNQIVDAQKPFVGYFHFWTPHEPYSPHRDFIGLFKDDLSVPSKPCHPLGSSLPDEDLQKLRREYDEYIANLDAEFGKFHQSLSDTGILENSYVIVTADHGQFFERGVHGHGTPLLYDPVVNVPLIISAPGQLARRDVYTPTSCVDLLPTILNMAGSDQPADLEGTALPGFGGDEVEKPIFAMEAQKNAAFQPLAIGTFAMIQGDYKLIWYRGYPGYEDMFELYDIRQDPEELRNLSNSKTNTVNELAQELKQRIAQADEPYEFQ